MYVKKEKLVSAFSEIEKVLTSYSLPTWDMLPDIELYMDQVISVVTKYLEAPNSTIIFTRPVTSSMINNYVKLGIIPPPVKKKYSKIHLAYLLIVCTLKQTLDMTTIQQIIPVDLDVDTVKKTYDSFVKNQYTAFNYVFSQTRKVADPIFTLEGNNQDRMNDLIMQVSVSATLFKLLTEKITQLDKE
ncbi:MAG: DUF1836 domain-containing protein [Ruminococcaceae bacterium]|nr:DUF1836 domain-containing protein [Oscillospiraceae bacterium]